MGNLRNETAFKLLVSLIPAAAIGFLFAAPVLPTGDGGQWWPPCSSSATQDYNCSGPGGSIFFHGYTSVAFRAFGVGGVLISDTGQYRWLPYNPPYSDPYYAPYNAPGSFPSTYKAPAADAESGLGCCLAS